MTLALYPAAEPFMVMVSPFAIAHVCPEESQIVGPTVVTKLLFADVVQLVGDGEAGDGEAGGDEPHNWL